MPKKTVTGLRSDLTRKRKNGMKWKDIGRDYPGVPLGTLCRIAKDESYTPKAHTLRAHLGLEPLPVEVTPCAKCGQLHEFKHRCPGAPTKPRRTYDISYKRLRELLQNPYFKDS